MPKVSSSSTLLESDSGGTSSKCVDVEKLQPSSLHEDTFYRPWGCYTVLARGEGYLTKKIVVYPGKRLSLQYHHHRDEHWVIVKGRARIVNGEKHEDCLPNQAIFIPREKQHRLENVGDGNLELIEVQYGNTLQEDDIVRLDDDFGRAP